MTSVWADLLMGESYVLAGYDSVAKGISTTKRESYQASAARFPASSSRCGKQGWGAGGSCTPELQWMVVLGGVHFAESSSAGSLQ